MSEGYPALVWAIVLSFVFGGLLPLMLSPFATPSNTNCGSVIGATQVIACTGAYIIENGIPVPIPNIFGIAGQAVGSTFSGASIFGVFGNIFGLSGGANALYFTIPSPFGLLPSVQRVLAGQFYGMSLIPDVVGLPLILIILTLYIYGIVKIILP